MSHHRKYNPNAKHELPWIQGVKESFLDLSASEAEYLLNHPSKCAEIPGKRYCVAVDNGKIYIFRDDNAGGYHAYQVTGNEIYSKYSEAKFIVAEKLQVSIGKLSRLD